MNTAAVRIAGWGIAACAVAAVACGGEPGQRRRVAPAQSPAAADRPASCPLTQPAPEPLPGVAPEHQRLDYWLAQTRERGLDVDEVLLSDAELARLEASFAVERERFHPQVDLLAAAAAAVEAPTILDKVRERRDWLTAKLDAGDYLRSDGEPWTEPLEAPDAEPALAPVIRVALDDLPFRCAPTAERFAPRDLDPHVDYNRCSTARAQEPILVYADWPGDYLLARTRLGWGYIRDDAPLSPPLSEADAARFVRGPFATVTDAGLRAGAATLSAGARVPLVDGGQAIAAATATGVVTAPAGESVRENRGPLTRRAVLTRAFDFLGSPYGLGGTGGGRDCSRLFVDLFDSFGLPLPRHSTWQSRAGSYRIDVTGMDEATRLQIIDAAHERGVVLLHLPGHIMLYLGRDQGGQPMALHALSEYLERCDGSQLDTAYKVNRVTVTNLELGRGSERTAFIERFTDVTVIGKPPGPELAALAALRPALPVTRKPSAAACKRAAASERLLVSPSRPSAAAPMRVIATQPERRALELTLFGPDGRAVPEPLRVGGPPFGLVATVESPSAGEWTAVLGDGEHVAACTSFRVSKRPQKVDTGAGDGPAWTVRRQWSPAMEDLYSIFVERLFDYPSLDETTWPNLHSLTRDREHNLLYDHLGLGEDEALELVPDCADLPYTLRAYFAWKLGLPFGFRQCGRAREGRPPRCDGGWTNLVSRAELGTGDDVRAFDVFATRGVRRGVHSSSGRTHPGDDDTDFYPVPLTRRALPPGTLFVDPYGHLLIVADWVDQGPGGRGILIGADAQPDGTVGRRRFWRGSFLFSPGTDSGGAGFKAFRPHRVADDGSLTRPDNRALRSRPHKPYSTEQYEGTADDFYDRMDALINPRPLDPLAAQQMLVDALEEAVVRRVVSVDNGEAHMREQGYATMDMPRGPAIFRTTGAWEDFATPSRDWRLLVSIYVTIGFPERLLRAPEQYGVAPDKAEAAAARLREALRSELESRRFSYTRSDGSTQELTLADVVDRREAFEMAYNPNDCVEIRWAAPEGTGERATCKRHAPAEQRQRMQDYRHWFSERDRPPM